MPGFVGVGYSDYTYPPSLLTPSTIFLISSSQGLFARDPINGTWSQRADTTDIGFGPSYGASPRGRPNTLSLTDTVEMARSTDGGNTWSAISPPSAISGDEEIRFIGHGADDDTIYIAQGFGSDGSNAGIWRTTNGGTSWTHIIGPYLNSDGNSGFGISRFFVMQQRIWFTDHLQVVGSEPEDIENWPWHTASLDGATEIPLDVIRDLTPQWGYISGVRDADVRAFLWESQASGVTPPTQLHHVNFPTVTALALPTGTNLTWNGSSGQQINTVLANSGGVTLISYSWFDGSVFRAAVSRATNYGTSGWDIVLGGTDNTTVRSEGQSFPPSGPTVCHDMVDPTQWWVLRNQNALINYSADNGLTWTTESVPGMTSTQQEMLLASG